MGQVNVETTVRLTAPAYPCPPGGDAAPPHLAQGSRYPACERSWRELEPCAVHQQVDRFAAWSWSRHRQCLAPSAWRRVVGFWPSLPDRTTGCKKRHGGAW